MGYAGWPIRVEQIANRDHLFYCWHKLAREGGQGAGSDGYTYRDFSPLEVGQIVGDLSAQVLSGGYFVEPVRPVRIPKKLGGSETRELKLGTLCDRVIGRALHDSFQSFWEKRFLPSSYGFRPQRTTWMMLADLEVAMQQTGDRVLAIDDIRNAFDNVPVDTLVDYHRQALARVRQENFDGVARERTLALIDRILRGHDHCRERGIDQGNPYSPDGLNVLLDRAHDRVVLRRSPNPRRFRYADNLGYLCGCVSDGRQLLTEVSALLNPLGLVLKGQEAPRDLGRGEQADLLGFTLRWNGQALCLATQQDSLDHLRQHLGLAHVTPNPPQTAQAAARSWINAFAPAIEDGDVTVVLTTAAECGFRELSRSALTDQWEEAREKWRKCRERSRRRHRLPVP
jgi:hypothetical protein